MQSASPSRVGGTLPWLRRCPCRQGVQLSRAVCAYRLSPRFLSLLRRAWPSCTSDPPPFTLVSAPSRRSPARSAFHLPNALEEGPRQQVSFGAHGRCTLNLSTENRTSLCKPPTPEPTAASSVVISIKNVLTIL